MLTAGNRQAGRARGLAEPRPAPHRYGPGTVARQRIRCAHAASFGFNFEARLYSASASAHCHCSWCIVRQQDMRFGKFRIELQCLPGCIDHFATHVFGWSADENCAECRTRACQADVSRCKRRVSS